MKKITFILLALISGTAFGQNAATADGTATVNAEIISPIVISSTGSDLDFGRIIGNAAGGIVTVDVNSDRTANNNDLLAPSTSVQASSFTVKAADGYNYKIDIPTINLLGNGDPMSIVFTSSLGNVNIQGTGANQDLTVGGALTVNPGQLPGIYTGTVTVTVSYE